MSDTQQFAERRKIPHPMSDQDFRQFKKDVSESLSEGTKQFTIISRLIDSLDKKVTESHAATNNRLDGLQQQIAENTKLTSETAAIAQQTADDTSGLVSMYKSANSAANIVATWSEKISKASKLMTPILVLGALVTMLAHGKVPTWDEFWKLLG